MDLGLHAILQSDLDCPQLRRDVLDRFFAWAVALWIVRWRISGYCPAGSEGLDTILQQQLLGLAAKC